MGLFDTLKHKREIERLERAVKETPSPNTYCALIKKYREIGDTDNALRVAQQGIDRFPNSDEIFDLYYRLRKGQAQKEIEALKKIIEERPNPAAFAQLAEIYKDLREEQTALKYCRRALELFPNDDSPYLIIGELRLRRFYKDLLVKDGKIAMENLEKACHLNNKNYKALLELAKFYLQIGAINKALKKLKSILLFAPEDDNVKSLLEIAGKIPKPSHEDIDILLQTIEDQRKLYYSLEGDQDQTQNIPLSPDIFQKPLETLKDVPEIVCLLICDDDGNLIAHHAQSSIDINTYYEAAATIYHTVQDSSRQMDIGRFQRGQIEGPFGSIHLLYTERVVYIAFGSINHKPEQVYKQLQRFISKVSFNLKNFKGY